MTHFQLAPFGNVLSSIFKRTTCRPVKILPGSGANGAPANVSTAKTCLLSGRKFPLWSSESIGIQPVPLGFTTEHAPILSSETTGGSVRRVIVMGSGVGGGGMVECWGREGKVMGMLNPRKPSSKRVNAPRRTRA